MAEAQIRAFVASAEVVHALLVSIIGGVKEGGHEVRGGADQAFVSVAANAIWKFRTA